jgi:parallel beta-helix repeat protein
MNGAAGAIENNICFENFHAGIGHSGASPLVRSNICHGNVRAGIGISGGASPTVTGNRCFKNRRAGIGIRTGADTRPVVEDNECFENGMAGIGVEEGARPFIRKNRVTRNALVAIGVTGKSEATITGNELARDGGGPPLISVLDESRAVVAGNTLRGGGVAGVLVKGTAEIHDNRFLGNGPRGGGPPNFAVWAQPGSRVIFTGNRVESWRHALSASGAEKIVAKDNEVSSFIGSAIVVKSSKAPAEVNGNVAISNDPRAKAVEVTGNAGDVSRNNLKREPTRP